MMNLKNVPLSIFDKILIIPEGMLSAQLIIKFFTFHYLRFS